METIRDIYRIGYGPSSSHTMGPARAAQIFIETYSSAVSYQTALYGSLALTGKGHFTDKILIDTFSPKDVEILWFPEKVLSKHTNGMIFYALDAKGKEVGSQTVYSVGGGAIIAEEDWGQKKNQVYKLTTMKEILSHARESGKSLWEFVEDNEGEEIWDYLADVWIKMKESISNGLENERVLPGDLHLARKASSYYAKAVNSSGILRNRGKILPMPWPFPKKMPAAELL